MCVFYIKIKKMKYFLKYKQKQAYAQHLYININDLLPCTVRI